MAHWKFSDSIYGQNINLFVGPKTEHDEFVRKFDPNYRVGREKVPLGNCYFDGTLEPPLLTMWLRPDFRTSSIRDQSTLAHECFHAVNYTLDYRGFTLSDSSEEAYAYYLSWLYEECMTRIKGTKCRQAPAESPSTEPCSNVASASSTPQT
jgi:hypothetical protein